VSATFLTILVGKVVSFADVNGYTTVSFRFFTCSSYNSFRPIVTLSLDSALHLSLAESWGGIRHENHAVATPAYRLSFH
jgi:hypothetical protein